MLAREPRKPRPGPQPRATDSSPRARQPPLLDLQRLAGNHAVTGAVSAALQRVAVKVDPPNETLYNNENATTGKASAYNAAGTPSSYGGTVKFQMERQGDSGVTITVRILFVNSPRKADGSPVGKPTAIPSGDERQAWAQKIVTEQVKPWNGKLSLEGESKPLPWSDDPPKKITLPVTFKSVAVFDLNAEHDKQIALHPKTTVAARGTGNPIDAGNYYLNQGAYTSDPNVIAAHEFGHLMGIDDEYSQSNEMMNALLHQAAPKDAPSARAALDKATIERMTLAGLKAPLLARLASVVPAVTAAFDAKRAAVKARLASVARTGVRDPAVKTALEARLRIAAADKVAPSVPGAVAFQTTRNFSNLTLADTAVASSFTGAALAPKIQNGYQSAFDAAAGAKINLPSLGATSINIASSVPRMTAAGGAQQANATGAAAAAIGAPATTVALFGAQFHVPPTGLVAKLTELPAKWGAAGSALETAMTPAAFATIMAKIVNDAAATEMSAAVAATLGAIVTGGPLPPAALQTQKALYKKALEIVNAAAVGAGEQLVGDLLDQVLQPVLADSVKDLQTTVGSEVDKALGKSPSAMAASAAGSPALTALVAHMTAQFNADKVAAAGGGRSPFGAGKTPPDQHVTYTVQSMMGSHADLTFRADQAQTIVKQFNDNLKGWFEKPFTAKVK